ncbi:hypothetical protein L7F22_032373, partial [Adiantum nelumboides]|nr:hypothetical protein [Adiantum nelumboides]
MLYRQRGKSAEVQELREADRRQVRGGVLRPGVTYCSSSEAARSFGTGSGQ